MICRLWPGDDSVPKISAPDKHECCIGQEEDGTPPHITPAADQDEPTRTAVGDGNAHKHSVHFHKLLQKKPHGLMECLMNSQPD